MLSGFLYSRSSYHYGLDVSGGVRLTYEMDISQLKPDQQSRLPEIQSRLVEILQSRAVGTLGVTEPSVVAKGNTQIVVELPGFTNVDEAKKTIGTSARIEFYHAKNVVTPKSSRRPYEFIQDENSGEPNVDFVKTLDPSGKHIKFGDPEYQKIIDGWGDPIISGEDLATAEPRANGAGWMPEMFFSSTGKEKMERWSRRYSNDQENLASVLDHKVLSIAPLKEGAILTDEAVIEGNFPASWVKNLTEMLKSGALPVNLTMLSSEKVDPTIGATALTTMVTAGLIAFGVTCLFMLGYYAFPGLVAVIALTLYVLFTLTVLKLINATFSLAAIAGFILSVGMAVDANILVFERFREEMKAGKSLSAAINLGFRRALPAIVDSNACTILTSLVLLQLGTGPVKGFATTLIIGVAISLFTAVTVTRSLLVFFVGSGIASNPKLFAVDRNWFHKLETKAHSEPLQVVNNAKKWFLLSGISILIGIPFIFIGGLKPNVEFRGGEEAVFAVADNGPTSNQIVENLAKAGYPGSNVKFGTFTPQDLIVTAPSSDKLTAAKTDDDKAAVVGTAAQIEQKPLKVEAFNGGIRATYDVPEDLSVDTINNNLKKAGFDGAVAETKPRANEQSRAAYVTIPPAKEITSLPTDVEKRNAIAKAAGLDPKTSKGYTEIGPSIQKETLRNAILGVLISSGLIIFYLAMRFGIGMGGFVAGFRFGVSAIGALVHDILFVLGVTAIVGYFMGWEISALFITSMLTIIGFSVHDTIVIFDRIRENLHHIQPGEDTGHLMNRSITQSFARSINTSMTVIVTLILLLSFGTTTPDLKLFCATMLAGILSGTYSSIYNASPILYLWDLVAGRSKGPAATLVGIMQEEKHRTAVITTRGATQIQTAPVPSQPGQQGGRTYGQVRRRANEATRKGSVELDDEE